MKTYPLLLKPEQSDDFFFILFKTHQNLIANNKRGHNPAVVFLFQFLLVSAIFNTLILNINGFASKITFCFLAVASGVRCINRNPALPVQ